MTEEIECCKRGFASLAAATDELKHIAEARARGYGHRKEIRAYLCSNCLKYHLTSKTLEEMKGQVK